MWAKYIYVSGTSVAELKVVVRPVVEYPTILKVMWLRMIKAISFNHLIFCIICKTYLSTLKEMFYCVSVKPHPKFALIQMSVITQLLFLRILPSHYFWEFCPPVISENFALPLFLTRCSSRYVYSTNAAELGTRCIDNILNFRRCLSTKPLFDSNAVSLKCLSFYFDIFLSYVT